MNAFLTALLPPLLDLAGIALAGWLVRVSLVAKKRWGLEIEARHRDALHAALMTGIRDALANGLTGQQAIDAAIRHARESVPDALASLKQATTRVVTSIAAAKLKEVVG